jgi:hypothetical protein
VALLPRAALSDVSVKPVNITGPEVVKMDWNTRSLICADMDGDQRNDLALIDNDSGKIEILFQNNPDNPKQKERLSVKRNRWEPVLEDALFWHDGIIMGMYGYDLAAGDLNGDGRTDFAFSGNLTCLNVFYQNAEGHWDDSWSYNNSKPQQWTGTVVIDDIDMDGRDDLAQLSQDELLVFYQDENGKLREPRHYKLSAPDAHNLIFSDVNGDGLPDAMYLCGNDRFRRTSVRFQQEAGIFGPEIGFPMPNGSIGLATIGVKDGRPAYASIDGKTRMIMSYVLEPDKKAPESLEQMQMNDYTLGATVKQPNLYAWGDFDGDKRTDIVVADPAGARILLFRQTERGDFEEGKAYPSLSKINAISTLHMPAGPDSLAVSSSSEEVAGIVEYTSKGRLGFPAPLPLEGHALSISAGHFENTQNESLALIEQRGDDYYITLVHKDEAGAWTAANSIKIANIKRRPDSMMPIRIDADDHDDLLVFTAKEPARLFLSRETGFEEVATDSPVRLSCMSGADASRVASEDMDGDGRPEMIVGTSGYMRALSLGPDNNLEIVDQYNSRNPSADIKGPLFVKLIPDSAGKQIIFFDYAEGRMELLETDTQDGVYRSSETWESDSQTGFLGMDLIDLGKDGGSSLLVMRQERFGIIPLDRPGWTSKPFVQAYESELDKTFYTSFMAGDLNGDSIPEIIAIDGRENLLDILERNDKDSFKSVMHFVIFDENPHASSRSSYGLEPREELIADLNNDGLNDVALLVHDRILIYTGKKPQ